MEHDKQRYSVKIKGPSVLGSALWIGTIAAGAYHGYMDAQGMPFEKKNLEWMLTYGPTLAQAGVSGFKGAFAGGLLGGIGGAAYSVEGTRTLKGALATTAATTTAGALGLGAVGAAWGAGKGAIGTIMGYGLGYMVGYAAR